LAHDRPTFSRLLLLDEQAEQIFAISDDIAGRARKIGGTTVRSIGDISRRQRIPDNDEEALTPHQMLSAVRDDNAHLTGFLRQTHELCEKHKRRGDNQHDRGLDRSDGAAHIVSVGDRRRG
jgi:DNA-binding ferritin-like protein